MGIIYVKFVESSWNLGIPTVTIGAAWGSRSYRGRSEFTVLQLRLYTGIQECTVVPLSLGSAPWSVPALGTGPLVGKLSHGMTGRMRLSVRGEGQHPSIQGSCETRLRNEVLEEMQMEPGRCCELGLLGKGTSELGSQMGLGAVSIHSFSSHCGD